MGLLENTIGAMLGHGASEGSDAPATGSPYAPLATALIGLLAAKAATGGFGDLGGLLGGKGHAPPAGSAPSNAASAQAAPTAAGGGLLDGLGALVDRFKGSGQGNLVESWIGSGQNQAASPQQVTQALGNETVDELARRSGLSSADVAAQLSQALPALIDRLTPAGRLPRHDELPR